MTRLKGKKRVKDSEDEDEDEDGSESEDGHGHEEEEEEEEEGQGGLEMFEGNREECKLVLVVRTDLGMGKGTAE